MNNMPPIPTSLRRQPTGEAMPSETKKPRQPRTSPLQKAVFNINAEIALIDKKLEGVEALQARKERLQVALNAMLSE
jgi:hypothetical protein